MQTVRDKYYGACAKTETDSMKYVLIGFIKIRFCENILMSRITKHT